MLATFNYPLRLALSAFVGGLLVAAALETARDDGELSGESNH